MAQETLKELDLGEDGLKSDYRNDKADSGMDEDSQPYKGNEEDEEVINVCKPKSKRAIIDDEDDEDSRHSNIRDNPDSEQGDKEISEPSLLKNAEQVLDAVLNDDSNNDSHSSDEEDNETLFSTIKKKKKLAKRCVESEDDETGTQNGKSDLASQTIFGNSDLFDAEEDNSRGTRDSGDETASDSNNEREDDEGFDESSIDPALLKKLKKGASKIASRPKKQVEQEEKLKLHSETQRIIRESRVNLPYHQPEPKKLQDFLARATNKQQQYSVLKGARDSTKAKVIEEMMTKDKLCNRTPAIVNDHSSRQIISNENNQVDISTKSETIESDNDSLPDLNSDHVTDDLCQLNEHKSHVIEDVENSLKESQDGAIENLTGSQKNDCLTNGEVECEQTSTVDSQINSGFQESDSLINSANKENEKTDTVEKDVGKFSNKKLPILSELPSIPKLNAGPENFIDLEVNSVLSKKPGVSKLMDRFMAHSKKKHKHVPKDVELSIIQKESTEGEKEELKLNTFVYHVTEEEDSMSQFDAPGAKLVALKEKLQQKMKVKREENRKLRQEVFDMDNEEGYVEEDKVLDDDDEMTDKSDTDVEDDDFDEQFNDEEDVIEEEENPFCDNEAEEDDDDDDEDDDEFRLHLSDSDNNGDNEDSDMGEEDDGIVKKKQLSSVKKKPKRLEISDDEESKLSSTNNPVDEVAVEEPKVKECIEDMGDEHFSPFSKHLTDNTQIQLKKTQSVDSNTQGVNFYIEESQMLDADGFLKVGSEKKSHPQKLKSPSFNNLLPTQDQGNMDELLGLCSGRFTDEDDQKTSCKNLFGMNTAPGCTQGNMEELLGLCSGKFLPNTQSGHKRKAEFDDDSLQMVSDVEDDDFVSKQKETFSDEEDDDIKSLHSEEEARPFKGFVSGKTGRMRKEFVDEEAELSGSEYDSDENLDLAEEDDIMEEELGDNDVTATEDELRNQVGRAHLKQIIDEDKRELMRFQEMYLPDGDLHSDAGRTRRFKWSNLDDDTQQDMFDKSDDEKEEDEGEEAKWRKDRFEREKWLQEQQECDKMKNDEDSQFLKLGKVFLKRQDSDSILLKKPEEIPTKPAPKSTLPAPKLSRRGSFLSRDKDALAKIANMTKTKSAMNPSGARNSGKFVFQVISPDKESQVMPAPAEPKMKKISSKQPPSKKPRLEHSASFSQSSIFNHL